MNPIEGVEQIEIHVGTEIELEQFDQMYDEYVGLRKDDNKDSDSKQNETRDENKKIPFITYTNSTDTLQKIVEKLMPNEWIEEQNEKWRGKGWGGDIDWSGYKLTLDGHIFIEYKSGDQKPFGGGPIKKFRCVAEEIKAKQILPGWLVKEAVSDPSYGEYGLGEPKWGTPEEARELLIRFFKESGLHSEDIA